MCHRPVGSVLRSGTHLPGLAPRFSDLLGERLVLSLCAEHVDAFIPSASLAGSHEDVLNRLVPVRDIAVRVDHTLASIDLTSRSDCSIADSIVMCRGFWRTVARCSLFSHYCKDQRAGYIISG